MPNLEILKRSTFKRHLVKDKLSFVLPFSTRKSTKYHHVEDGENCKHTESMRLKISLLSLVKNFNLTDLCEFLIVSPPFDIYRAEKILRSVTNDERFKVISELEICPEFEILGLLRSSKLSSLYQNFFLLLQCIRNCIFRGSYIGWLKQQLIKLAVCDVVRSSHYITLDADVICVRKFTLNDIIQEDRALCQVEDIRDYLDLYNDFFASKEYCIKMHRCLRVVRILGFNRPNEYRDRIYSETPVIMNTKGVWMLTQYIQNKYSLEWRKYLIKNFASWTEYPLYFQFLEGTGLLEQMYMISKKHKLWDPSTSFWQPEHRYRHEREFNNIDEYLRGVESYFIVLQTGWGVSSGNFFEKIARKIQEPQWNPE